jgi:hypothetical protein
MARRFAQNLARLRNVAVTVAADNEPDAEGSANIVVKFADGTVLKSSYWRLIQGGRTRLSSFEHQKKYGLPAPIDAKETISALLEGKICLRVHFDGQTADLTLVFGETTTLQVFNFTGYEVWHIRFPDGTGEYSNYALMGAPIVSGDGPRAAELRDATGRHLSRVHRTCCQRSRKGRR